MTQSSKYGAARKCQATGNRRYRDKQESLLASLDSRSLIGYLRLRTHGLLL